jgi:hypothetical protein
LKITEGTQIFGLLFPRYQLCINFGKYAIGRATFSQTYVTGHPKQISKARIILSFAYEYVVKSQRYPTMQMYLSTRGCG